MSDWKNRKEGKYLVRERVSGDIYEMEWVTLKNLRLHLWYLNGIPLGTQPREEDVIKQIL